MVFSSRSIPRAIHRAVTLAGIGWAAGCRGGEKVDTNLSTELVNARLGVVAWPPTIGSKVPSLTQPAHTKCGLLLRDERSGINYQLERSHKGEGAGAAASWFEYGDYAPLLPDAGAPPSYWVRIECGTWKVIGLVSAKRGA
jgi:hypothetical protein